jgi:hypothetical protein
MHSGLGRDWGLRNFFPPERRIAKMSIFGTQSRLLAGKPQKVSRAVLA